MADDLELLQTYMDIVACDLSMRRPGFALLRYYYKSRHVKILETSNIDNKTTSAGKNKCYGEVLSEIAAELRRLLTKVPLGPVVREEALKKSGTCASGKVLSILNRVVGVSDLYAWGFGGREFVEITPQTVKKLVTDNANAEKDEVAAALKQFVGDWDYACDDESDAVAVGVAWLIQQKMIDNPYEKVKKK